MHTFIIISGLALGIGVCLVIAQYIYFEYSFDKDVAGRDRIQYVYTTWSNDRQSINGPCFPAVAPLLSENFPDVESAVRVTGMGVGSDKFVVRREEGNRIKAYSRIDKMLLADPEVLEFFNLPLLAGNSQTALQEPNSMVITRSTADKLFPNEDAINKSVIVQINSQARSEWVITGIAADPLPNSSLQFSTLASINVLKSFWSIDSSWQNAQFRTFVKFREKADVPAVKEEVNEIAQPLRKLESLLNNRISIDFAPFSDYHFFRHTNTESVDTMRFTGDRSMIVYLTIVGLLTIVISWGNYLNLTTARALQRAKEVGIRKINGATRMQVMNQFMVEFLLINCVAFLVALTFAQLLFPLFARSIGSEARWIFWNLPGFWFMAIVFILLATVLPGFYPAIVLANSKPVRIIKGVFARSQSGLLIRKSLVVFQFGLSALLIMSIYVISRQWYHLEKRQHGFSTEQVLIINTVDLPVGMDRAIALQSWRQAAHQRPDVLSVSASDLFMGEGVSRTHAFRLAADEQKTLVTFLSNGVADNYFSTLGLKILHGRELEPSKASDKNKLIINETGARNLGFQNPVDALGQEIVLSERNKRFEIVGVLQDFSVNAKSAPQGEVFHTWNMYDSVAVDYHYFLVKLSSSDMSETMSHIRDAWDKTFAGAPFEYFFLDSYFEAFYREERQFTSIFAFFGCIGVLIACMGLFGLSVYDTSSRSKEIGIRKTLGASAMQVMWLFSRNYLLLVIAASLLGIPLGLFFLRQWLDNYPYHIILGIDAVIFPVSALLSIALLTVGYHTWKTAHTNPVDALRAD